MGTTIVTRTHSLGICLPRLVFFRLFRHVTRHTGATEVFYDTVQQEGLGWEAEEDSRDVTGKHLGRATAAA